MSSWWWYVTDDEAGSQTFQTAGVGRAGRVGPPLRIYNFSEGPGADLPALRLWVYQRPDMDTVVGELTYKRSMRWQVDLSEVGSGVPVIGAEDPLLPLDDDQLIAVETYGQVVFSLLPDLDQYSSIGPDGIGGRDVTMNCKGHGWVLNEGVVYPTRTRLDPSGVTVGADPTEDDRAFGWWIPQYDDSFWGTARVMATESTANWDDTYLTNWPGGLDGSAGQFIWGTPGDSDHAPAGDVFFRKTFTVGSSGLYTVFLIADDRAHLYVDGQRVIITGNWTNSNQDVNTQDLQLSAGEHNIAIWGQNNAGGPPGNPAMVRAVIAQRNLDGSVSNFVVGTDDSWAALSYPIFVPGVTAGMILRICLEEAQARGSLEGVTWTFTDDIDSAGNQWPPLNDVTTKVGGSIVTLLKEMSDTYIDWTMTPSRLELNVYLLDGAGEDTGHTLHGHTDPNDATTGNLAELTQKRQR